MTAPPPVGPGRVPGRGNGLPARSYVPLVEVDPRTAGTLLAELAAAGIAAYVAPSTGTVGGWLDVKLPARPVDRLYVDARLRAQARAVLDGTLPGPAGTGAPAGADQDETFRAIVAHFHDSPQGGGPAPRTVRPALPLEPPPPGAAVARTFPGEDRTFPGEDEVGFPADEGHYEPPPPAPAPRLSTGTKWSLCSMTFGALLLFVPGLVGMEHSDGVDIAAVLFVLGGVATLVARMRDAPPTDWRGPDDGAVV